MLDLKLLKMGRKLKLLFELPILTCELYVFTSKDLYFSTCLQVHSSHSSVICLANFQILHLEFYFLNFVFKIFSLWFVPWSNPWSDPWPCSVQSDPDHQRKHNLTACIKLFPGDHYQTGLMSEVATLYSYIMYNILWSSLNV